MVAEPLNYNTLVLKEEAGSLNGISPHVLAFNRASEADQQNNTEIANRTKEEKRKRERDLDDFMEDMTDAALDQLEGDYSDIVEQIQNIDRQIDRLLDRMANLTEYADILRRQGASESDIQELREQIETIQKYLDLEREKLEGIEDENERVAAQERIEALSNQFRGLQGRMEQLNEQQGLLTTQVTVLQQGLRDDGIYENDLSDEDRVLELIESDQSKVEELLGKRGVLETRMVEMEARMVELGSKMELQSGRLSLDPVEKRAMQDEKSALEEAITTVDEALEATEEFVGPPAPTEQDLMGSTNSSPKTEFQENLEGVSGSTKPEESTESTPVVAPEAPAVAGPPPM